MRTLKDTETLKTKDHMEKKTAQTPVQGTQEATEPGAQPGIELQKPSAMHEEHASGDQQKPNSGDEGGPSPPLPSSRYCAHAQLLYVGAAFCSAALRCCKSDCKRLWAHAPETLHMHLPPAEFELPGWPNTVTRF